MERAFLPLSEQERNEHRANTIKIPRRFRLYLFLVSSFSSLAHRVPPNQRTNERTSEWASPKLGGRHLATIPCRRPPELLQRPQQRERTATTIVQVHELQLIAQDILNEIEPSADTIAAPSLPRRSAGATLAPSFVRPPVPIPVAEAAVAAAEMPLAKQ